MPLSRAGLIGLVVLTVDPAYEAAHRWVEAALWACLAFFSRSKWLARLFRAFRARRGIGLRLLGRRAGGRRRRTRGADRDCLRRRCPVGVAAGRVLAAQAGSGDFRDCGGCAGCWCWNPGRSRACWCCS